MKHLHRKPGSSFVVLLSALVLGTGSPATAQDTGGAEQEDGAVQDEELLRRLRELEDRLLGVEATAELGSPGSTRFLWSGYAFTRYTDAEGMNSSFRSVFAPLVLWRVDDRLFFESEFEFALELDDHGETELEIEYMNAAYIVNDHLMVGGGLFLTPFGLFAERIHPAWINKLPDMPLSSGHDGIVPFNSVGVWARGGFATGSSKWNYSVYVSNGPRLNTGEDEPDEAGVLHFDNYEDVDNSRAIGGRLGYLPVPELELGASFLTGGVTSSGSDVEDADAEIFGVDLSYNWDARSLKGRAELRAEWAWSDVDNVTYDPTGALGFGPLTYDNERSGGYVMASYRPIWSENDVLDDLEAVFRFDNLHRPSGAPESFDENRYTVGLNYWLSPSSVLKAAYRFDDRDGGEEDVDALLLQFAVGF
ncbi:MAG: hypothetical protein O7J95_00250 [Planctomycetota bacterium]|nr:hypothetical protein [Planctomycetota bacterium]